MKKHLLGSVALLALAMSAPAVAADMRVPAAAPAAVTNWSGCYIGGFVGYQTGHSQHRSDNPNGTTNVIIRPDPSSGNLSIIQGEQLVANSSGDITNRFNESGLLGGADVGCNIQTGYWVWGFEVDIADKNLDGQATDLGPIFNPAFVSQTTERWSGTARLRAGFMVDKWLFYVTGGYAAAQVEATSWYTGAGYSLGVAPPGIALQAGNLDGSPSIHDKKVIGGYTVGAGMEYALGYGWSAKSEFLYINYGWHQFFNPPESYWPGISTFVAPRSVHLDSYVFKWGLNYKFNWGKAAPAVVTKY